MKKPSVRLFILKFLVVIVHKKNSECGYVLSYKPGGHSIVKNTGGGLAPYQSLYCLKTRNLS